MSYPTYNLSNELSTLQSIRFKIRSDHWRSDSVFDYWPLNSDSWKWAPCQMMRNKVLTWEKTLTGHESNEWVKRLKNYGSLEVVNPHLFAAESRALRSTGTWSSTVGKPKFGDSKFLDATLWTGTRSYITSSHDFWTGSWVRQIDRL